MTTQKPDDPEPSEKSRKPRDPDFIGAEAALSRAAERARRVLSRPSEPWPCSRTEELSGRRPMAPTLMTLKMAAIDLSRSV